MLAGERSDLGLGDGVTVLSGVSVLLHTGKEDFCF